MPSVFVTFTGCLRLVVHFQSDMDDLEQESINQELIEFALQESIQDLNKSAKTSRFDQGNFQSQHYCLEFKKIWN